MLINEMKTNSHHTSNAVSANEMCVFMFVLSFDFIYFDQYQAKKCAIKLSQTRRTLCVHFNDGNVLIFWWQFDRKIWVHQSKVLRHAHKIMFVPTATEVVWMWKVHFAFIVCTITPHFMAPICFPWIPWWKIFQSCVTQKSTWSFNKWSELWPLKSFFWSRFCFDTGSARMSFVFFCFSINFARRFLHKNHIQQSPTSHNKLARLSLAYRKLEAAYFWFVQKKTLRFLCK